uniref:Nucleotide-diphospho-sugar transferase domain-containing protein n=1 Tax=viral metagenome TaxID=1070528 RepID=A0A6C0IW11_9ZZZZ
MNRNAYLLTVDPLSKRAIFSKNILEQIGFNVILVTALTNSNKVLSNKLSMLHIYEIISKKNDSWSYVFEDDINLLEKISIDEIIQYENISEMFFYLGCCRYLDSINNSNYVINNYPVYTVQYGVRGLHSIGISKQCATQLIEFSKIYENEVYMDVILEHFCNKCPANVVRYDLESYIEGHRGIVFQDRHKFPTSIF